MQPDGERAAHRMAALSWQPLAGQAAPQRVSTRIARFLRGKPSQMSFACQSLSTLDELLVEAAGFIACLPCTIAGDFSKRIQDLRRVIHGNEERVSAAVEVEIVSLWERARIAHARSPVGQISPSVAGTRKGAAVSP
ncbi:MAG: hypothetical protein ACRENE_12535 [Polyangiaceae bacterium]